MSQSWPLVALGQVLHKSNEVVPIVPMDYTQVTVRLWGQGVVPRNIVQGAEIAAPYRYVVRPQQFILSRIDARNGAFGLVPDSLDGAVVSNDFPVFNVDQARLSPSFLNWMSKTHNFVDLCKAASEGTTNRVRLKEERFLSTTIPLPSLSEQQRILARIEELAGKIDRTRTLRRNAIEEVERYERQELDSMYLQLVSECGSSLMSEITTCITDGDHNTPTFVEEGVRFIFVGNVSSGFLHFDGCKCVDREYYSALRPIRKPNRGDILYSAVGATLGIPAVVDCDSDFCFQRHIALLKPDHQLVIPRFLWYMLRCTTVFKLAWAGTTGSAQPTVPLRAIRQLPIPVPDMEKQRQVVAYLDDLRARMDAVKALQTQTDAEINALLPSILDRAFRGEL